MSDLKYSLYLAFIAGGSAMMAWIMLFHGGANLRDPGMGVVLLCVSGFVFWLAWKALKYNFYASRDCAIAEPPISGEGVNSKPDTPHA